MKPPRQYDEWCDVCDAFATPARDAEVLSAVSSGEFPSSAGKTERTVRRLADAYEKRLLSLRTALTHEMERATDPFDVERALARFVTGLDPLAKLAVLPSLPANIRDHLRKTLDDYVKRLRDALIDSAKRDRESNGELVASIRRVNLSVPWNEPNRGTEVSPTNVFPVESHHLDGRQVRRILI